MPADNIDDHRAVRAALSAFTSGALPADLVPLAESYGLDPQGWAFPAAFTKLTLSPPPPGAQGGLVGLGRQLIDTAAQHRAGLLIPGDPGWPAHSAARHLPCLWISNTSGLFDGLLARAVTITGSKACTSYGAHVASDLSYDLASRGITIVTAAGFGIGDAVIRSAAAAGGNVIAVTGAGVLSEDQPLALRRQAGIASSHGAVISPFPPGSQPSRSALTIRNWVLASLTPAMVIVEAGPRSSTLTVARYAVAQGGRVFAVPGPVTSATSHGCHELLRDGTARLITNHDDLLAALPALTTTQPAPTVPADPDHDHDRSYVGSVPGGSSCTSQEP